MRLFEYLIILPPPHSISIDVQKFKLKGHLEHGWPTWSIPHFTVCNIVQPGYNESHIVSALKRLASHIKPFYMELSGFDYFVGSTYTIYIKPLIAEEFSALAKETKKSIRNILIPLKDFRPSFTINPHLTLVKQLAEKEFKQAWPKWKNRPYHAKCDIEHILLLKRELSPIPKKYEIVGTFPFLGDGNSNHQMLLF